MEFASTPTGKPANEDLSVAIVESVDREPSDVVRCVRVTGNFYRCNWWSAQSTASYDNPEMKMGQLSTTHRIRQSRFLEATRTSDGLSIRIIKTPNSGRF